MKTKTLSTEHQLQLNDLHNEIRIIKENHLAHMADSISDLNLEIKETKDNFEKRFDKLDERIWVVIGLVVTTLIGIVVSGVM